MEILSHKSKKKRLYLHEIGLWNTKNVLKMKRRCHVCFAYVFLLLFFSSCSLTKYVPENETLLNNVKIKTENKDFTTEDIKPYIQQTSNKKLFNLMRVKLGVYNSSGRDTTKRINRWLRKIGEPPVIYNPEFTEKTITELERRLANKGYMRAEVTAEVTEKKQKTNVLYWIKTNEPYFVNSYELNLEDDSASYFVQNHRFSEPLIKPGDIYNLDNIDAERDRVTTILRNRGFYHFKKEMLYLEADSLQKNRTIDLKMKMLPEFSQEDSTIVNPFLRKKINKIYVITEADSEVFQQIAKDSLVDTITYRNIHIIYGKKRYLRPKVLASHIFLEPNGYYRDMSVERTVSSLNSLAPVKYVSVNFREVSDELLDCYVIINPDKNHSFSIEVEGTNSDGNFGVAGEIGYSYKNLFRGGETVNVNFRGAYEAMGIINNKLYTSNDIGGNVSLNVPMLIFPLKKDSKIRTKANTEFTVGYNHQTRPQYQRDIANAGIKYVWNRRLGLRYNVDLLDISYVYLPYKTSSFEETYMSNTSSLRFSFEDQFIMRFGGGFTYTTQRENYTNRDYMTIRIRAKTAGNLLYGISHAINQEKDEDGIFKIGKVPYAQFVKGEIDFVYNKYINDKNRFAFHAALGIGFPYGNGNILPFEERYFSGGANSVRGWSVRDLGPGSYHNQSGAIDFMRQSGDIKFDLSFEYRFKMFWLIEGAAFFDAGNIWTIKNYEDQPGGLFKFSDFYKQIACSYGIGLRADFDFFVIRVDMGIKLYDPSKTASERWRGNLTADDLAFHFAIGYPF